MKYYIDKDNDGNILEYNLVKNIGEEIEIDSLTDDNGEIQYKQVGNNLVKLKASEITSNKLRIAKKNKIKRSRNKAKESLLKSLIDADPTYQQKLADIDAATTLTELNNIEV